MKKIKQWTNKRKLKNKAKVLGANKICIEDYEKCEN